MVTLETSANPVRSNEVYAEIFRRYDAKNSSPSGIAERASVLSALGDLTGKSVLDIGCGTGFYPRVFRRVGANEVVGIDLSEEMIGVGRQLEELEQAGISYHVLDAANLPDLGQFDVVTNMWLVNHMTDPVALAAFIEGFARLTAPGGTALLLTTNRDGDWKLFSDDYRRYGFTMTFNEAETAGNRPYLLELDSGGKAFSFQSTSWSPQVLEEEFTRVGFRTIERMHATLPTGNFPWVDGDHTANDADFFQDLLRSPAFTIFRLTK
ncbi:class I SAM-dependent methyltransferase [Pendulispora rubella]|uniref:Class I SAM-dependent methyltransferase n=1 Tax=Pendulispora rubella TaxID=2741070 RepID=A0ABZ2LC55_9BACT